MEFDPQSIRGPLMEVTSPHLVFEARLKQNLDLKATFAKEKINGTPEGSPAKAK